MVIETYPAAIDLIVGNGHEVGLHGYMHERSNQLSRDEEAGVLVRSLEAYSKRIGGRPRGWRAPGFAFSKHSLDLLVDAGFDYDSSLMGDDIPYAIQGTSGRLVGCLSQTWMTGRTTCTTVTLATRCQSLLRRERWKCFALSLMLRMRTARFGFPSGIRSCQAGSRSFTRSLS